MNHRHPRRIALWRMPVLIGVASLCGLIVGLVGDGALDVAAWLALGVPIVAIGWSLGFGRR